MRVLLADEHPKVRWALRTVLHEEPGLTVVGEVSTTAELVPQAQILQPDLILLDWELPGRFDGVLPAALRSLGSEARIIVLSKRPDTREAAVLAGADAFVSTGDAPDQFLAALRRAIRG